ncbi:LysR family transcriptional regulator [Agrobacterium sp. a22-2]|uniref:LysR family transcriptional regulator n=1 Tax=Agrobacterium sp. a22-2 TaxID=2283840 RepID=UPI0014455B0D|nr:LysR family transcriptional regulator [Agrobacterium sp. a22-2]NKN39806.1 LysR family transcriptional regulator [Agrobacterium sp. a22-2]
MEQLPPLASLIAFDALYRTGSVTAAARLLGRTHSAVSKQLHHLQDHAGVELFRKQGTGLELTADGKTFARTVIRSFDDLRSGYGALKRPSRDAPVSIAVSATFARVWFIPTVSRFNVDWPEIDIVIRLAGPMGSRELDPPPDLLMSWDRLLSPMREDPFAVPLGDVEMGPVLGPAHRHSWDGATLDCATRIDRRGAEIVWDNWQRLSGHRFRADRVTGYDHSYLVFEAARMGMGAAIAPRFLVEDELASGALVAPAGFLTFRDGFYVRPHETREGRLSRNARIFLEWLRDNARLPASRRVSAPATGDPA